MRPDLQNQVTTYSDLRITNILQQGDFFDQETVSAARQTALQRGLYTEDQLKAFEKYPAVKKIIKDKLQAGIPQEKLKDHLLKDFGIGQDQAEELLHYAQNHTKAKDTYTKGGEVDQKFLVIGLAILFFIIKILFMSILRR